MGFQRLMFGVMYRVGFKPWDGHGLPARLKQLVEGDGALPPGRALDLGCGTGDMDIYLARHGWKVTAVDFVEHPLRQARSKAKAAGVDVTFLRADVTRLGESSAGTGFTLVLDGGCMHGLPDEERDAYIREVSAATAPGGRLVLMGFAEAKRRGPRGIDRPEVERRFSEGWELLDGGLDPSVSNIPEDPIYTYD